MKTKNLLKWIVLGGVTLLVIGFIFSLFVPRMWGGMTAWGYDDCGMWGGSDMMGYRPFGRLGMLLSLLIPLGVLALLVAGGVWLVRAVTSNGSPFTCPSCGQNVQMDWLNCPYCSAALEE